MFEIKQLKYFVVSADMGSFTAAAQILYTTQTNVSKTVSALEKKLGFPLFQREARGIRLTPKGQKFYQKANVLVSGMESLEREALNDHTNTVTISANPSSWFADMFSFFYDEKRADPCCFQVHVGSTADILQRVRNGEDEVGFIHVFPDYAKQFEYDLGRYKLSFEVLREMDAMLYFSTEKAGQEKTGSEKKESAAVDLSDLSQLRLVQMSCDEFSSRHGWKLDDGGTRTFHMPEVSVLTNSDYIMGAMLKKEGLANISGETFFRYGPAGCPGVRLFRDEGKIRYGALTSQISKPGKIAEEFVGFMRGKLLQD